MFQLYPFRGDDYTDVYGHVNEFLQQLDTVNGIEVKREEIHEDTKNYLDYDRSVTTVTVCVRFVDGYRPAQTAQIAKVATLYTDCTRASVAASEDELRLKEGHHLELHKDTDGWLLVDCHDDQRQVVFRDIQSGVLESLRHHLQRDPADDFDPFLESDDLP